MKMKKYIKTNWAGKCVLLGSGILIVLALFNFTTVSSFLIAFFKGAIEFLTQSIKYMGLIGCLIALGSMLVLIGVINSLDEGIGIEFDFPKKKEQPKESKSRSNKNESYKKIFK